VINITNKKMAIDWGQINSQFEGKTTEKKKKGAIDWEQINQRFAGVAKPETSEYGTWQLPNQPDTAYSGIKKFGYVPVGTTQKSFTNAQPMSIAPAQKESAFPRTQEALGIAAQSVYKTGESPLSIISKPSDWWAGAKALWEEGLLTISKDNLKRIADFVDTYKTPTTTAEKTGKGIEAAMIIPNTLFGAITGLFVASEKIPTLKPLADIISVPFALGGEIGSKISLGILEKLPFDKQTKDYLYKGIDEVGSLTGMIAAGGAIHGTVKSLNKTKLEIIKEKPELKPQIEKVPDEVATKLEKDYGQADAKTIIERAAEQARLEAPKIEGLITAPKEKLPALGKTDDLFQEARKYKTAEEFVSIENYKRNLNIPFEIKKAIRVAEEERMKFGGETLNGSEFAQKLLDDGWKIETYPKGNSIGYKAVKIIDGNKSTINVSGGVAKTHKFYQESRNQTKSQLTDIWNQANKKTFY